MKLEESNSLRALVCLVLLTGLPLLPAAGQDKPASAPATPALHNTLNLIVTDKKHHFVANLRPENFTVYDADQSQQVTFVTNSSNSACLGLVIDFSGSMRRKHPLVAKAMLDLVSDANAEGQTFVVNFNDSPFLDQDFTNQFGRIRSALNRGEPRGGTALYDALIASADHLAAAGECPKKILVVVTDGDDNSSRKTLADATTAIEEANGPVVYLVGLPSDQHAQSSKTKSTLEALAANSGGDAFFPGNIKDIDKMISKIAEEIRDQYSVTYLAAAAQRDGSFRKIQVAAQSPEHNDLMVRVKPGYYARWASRASPLTTSLSADETQGPDFHCITGVVFDDNNLPVAGITVRATPSDRNMPRPFPFTRSNMDGKFRLANLRPGSYELSTVNLRAGYPPTSLLLYGSGRSLAVTVPPEEGCIDVVVHASAKAAHLKINVVDTQTRLQLTRFIVVLRRADSPDAEYTITTDLERGVLLPPITQLTVQIEAPGYAKSDPMPITSVASDMSQELTVELQPNQRFQPR